MFFNNGVYSRIFIKFMKQLDNIETIKGYFQQNDAVYHVPDASIVFTPRVLEDRVVLKEP